MKTFQRFALTTFFSLLSLVITQLPAYAQIKLNSVKLNSLKLELAEGGILEPPSLLKKVIIFTNVTPYCGFTAQLGELEQLYQAHKDTGLIIIGIPVTDFSPPMKDSSTDIKNFCTSKFNVTFPILKKTLLKDSAVLQTLSMHSGENYSGKLEFNFEKFVLDRKGMLRARFGSVTNPMSHKMQRLIKELLEEDE